MDRNDREVEKTVSMHLHAFEQSYKCQIVTDTKSRNALHFLHLKSTNLNCNVIIFFLKHSNIVKKTWDGIKTIAILKRKAQASLNSLMLNRHSITSKTSITNIQFFFVNNGPYLSSNIPKSKHLFNSYLKIEIELHYR